MSYLLQHIVWIKRNHRHSKYGPVNGIRKQMVNAKMFKRVFFNQMNRFCFYVLDEIFPHQERQVRDYIIHPDYRPGSEFNDIALLIISQPFRIAENVNTICLPPKDFVFDHQRCFATGNRVIILNQVSSVGN